MFLTDQKSTNEKSVNVSMDLYEKSKKNRELPEDAFESGLSLASIFSKITLVSLFMFFVSLGFYSTFTLAALGGFLVFGFFFLYFRIRSKC